MRYTVHIVSHVERAGYAEPFAVPPRGVEVDAISPDAAAERVADAISRLIREQDDDYPDSRRDPDSKP